MSLASFSETSWLVYSSALRSMAIVSSKSSFNSLVGLLFSPFFKQRVAVSFRSVIIRVGVWVRQFLNSWPSANRARVSCIKLIDWDTDNMLSLSFNSVDSNKSLAFAEATGIVLRTELFTWSSQRNVSSPCLHLLFPILPWIQLCPDSRCPMDGIDLQSPWILDSGWICQVQV